MAAQSVSFNRDIRPIMADTCFRCHGPDPGSRMAGMRLDLREEALKPTKTKVVPIVPGDPARSAIVERIFSRNPARVMPPRYAHKTLTDEQKETIRRWVAEGAVYEGHWAYNPVRRPAIPEARHPDAPVRNPIDAFIARRLALAGLAPSPEADRRTLIRRVTLDLTGLPPRPDQIEDFLRDRSPGAYERLVDRLLQSPAYAEKQALHWLDAVRYADTAGFHGDNPFPIWPYRDYVLRAFRSNKPFDEFTREQLAGDLLPERRTGQLIASAYNRLNRMSAEGGVQPGEYLAKYAADRVRTTSTVWLGSTIGCAECHDHKFDPFTARDFYSMKAFFADIKETGLVPDRGPDAWGSQIALPSPAQRARMEGLSHRLEEIRCRIDAEAEALAARRPAWEAETLKLFEEGRLAWRYQRPVSARSENGARLTIFNSRTVDSTFEDGGSLVSNRQPGNGIVVASGPNPDKETYIISFRPGEGEWAALGVEVIQDESLPGARVARGADRFVLTEVEAAAGGPGRQRKIGFSLAGAALTYPAPELSPLSAIDGNPETGWGMRVYGEPRNPFLALRFAGKLKTSAQTAITVRLRQESRRRRATIGRFRLALTASERSWPGVEARGAREPEVNGLSGALLRALRAPAPKRTPAQRAAIDEQFRRASPELEPLLVEEAKLASELGLLEAEIPRVVVTESVPPRQTRVLPRGNWMDESGAVVEPAIPAFLGKLDTDGRATRLDLAGWIVSRDNPLTARVFVNRAWRQFFGAGISKTLDDLGSQGEWPSHPELLDWLAAEFMDPQWEAGKAHAWDVMHLIRLIVTSHTYRQSSLPVPGAVAKDPDNRLLARQNRFRVDAEIVRDIALAVSGLLVEEFGGPSVRPFQPDGYLAALNFPKREYSASRGEALYRRGLYVHWQRTFLHPALAAFDAPSREECTVNRTASNTPLQSLVLLNDPAFVEAARVFAGRILSAGGHSLAARLNWAFLRAVGREPTAEERGVLAALHARSLAHFRASPEAARKFVETGEAPRPKGIPAAELAATANVARVILNLHETITRD